VSGRDAVSRCGCVPAIASPNYLPRPRGLSPDA